MKKHLLIWIIAIAAVAVVVVTTTVSLAFWHENKHNSLYVHLPMTDENPSLKYQMFVPVVASGNETTTDTSAYRRVAGTFSFSQDEYSYTLTNAADLNSITGFALTGWFGGIAVAILHVPDQVTVKVNGQNVTKPVVRVMVDADFIDYSFSGANTAITDIVVGTNVVEIDSCAFFGMAFLERLVLEAASGNTEDPNYIYMRPNCFGGCLNLTSLDEQRARDPEWDYSSVYLDSGLMG